MPSIRTLGYIFVALCAIVILASFQTNMVIEEQMEVVKREYSEETIKKAYKGKRRQPKTTAPAAERAIQPADPAQYGMVVTPKKNVPKTLEQWEIKLAVEMDRNDVFGQPAAGEVLEKVRQDAAQYEQEMADLEKKIAETQQQLEEDPLNASLEEKLANLYKVRAVGKILKRKAEEDAARPAPSQAP